MIDYSDDMLSESDIEALNRLRAEYTAIMENPIPHSERLATAYQSALSDIEEEKFRIRWNAMKRYNKATSRNDGR